MKLTLSTVVSGLALVSTSTSTVAANKAFSASSKAPVDVTLFVMSRCPDAVKCEGVFSKVFQAENLPTVNPSLSFIGSINRSSKTSFSTSEDGTTVTCKHGPLECAGNTQQLCFKKYFPDHEIWVPFVVAMNSLAFHRIGDPEYAREIGEKVLYEGGQNIFYTYHEADHLLEKVDDCSKGQEGFDLLVESIQHTIDHGVGTSCTVFIDNKKRCVVDGGVWRECPEGSSISDFVRSITQAAARVQLALTGSRLFRWNA